MAGGIYLGSKMNSSQTAPVAPQPAATAPTTPAAQPVTETPVASPTPTVFQPTPSVWTKGDTFVGTAPFVGFTTYLMTGWTEKKETVGTGFKVTIANGNYQIVISQAPGGGGTCTYPGDQPVQMASPFNQPTDIPGFPDTNRQFRRATQPGEPTGATLTYLFCQQKSGNTYAMPTDYGYISYVVPQNPSSDMLVQMDATIGMVR